MANHDYLNNRCRIRPNASQRTILARWFGARNYVWRKLAEGLDDAAIKAGAPWLAEIPPSIIRHTITNWRNSKGTSKRAGNASTGTCRLGVSNSTLSPDGYLTLPDLGRIRLRGYRDDMGGKVDAYQITRDRCGDYWLTISRKIPLPASRPPREAAKVRGVDLGLKDLLVDDQGRKVAAPYMTERTRAKLSALFELLKSCRPGGKNAARLRAKIARVYRQFRDRCENYLHKATTALVRRSQGLGLETLNAAEIVARHPTSGKAAAIGKTLVYLNYKAARRGIPVHQVGRYFPSSQICPACSRRDKPHGVEIRVWTCPACGVEHDRDTAAAQVLRQEALSAFDRRGWRLE